MRAARARPALENIFGTPTRTFRPRGFEAKFVDAHVNAPAAKCHAFVLKPQPLLHPRRAAQFDVTARAHYAVPGNGPVRRAQRPRNLPRVTRITSGSGHAAVGRNLAFRDFPDGSEQIAEHVLTSPAPLPELRARPW